MILPGKYIRGGSQFRSERTYSQDNSILVMLCTPASKQCYPGNSILGDTEFPNLILYLQGNKSQQERYTFACPGAHPNSSMIQGRESQSRKPNWMYSNTLVQLSRHFGPSMMGDLDRPHHKGCYTKHLLL